MMTRAAGSEGPEGACCSRTLAALQLPYSTCSWTLLWVQAGRQRGCCGMWIKLNGALFTCACLCACVYVLAPSGLQVQGLAPQLNTSLAMW